ncbi:Ribonuclease S-4 [Acorus gramineus]|uniref:Ribonuclease S-4 n=1 Tax=Acorus gramineus TaxID=55184 RepID=A0AAV9A254_ACOGR|nr:Ribonuclease S-4 [Acorus gramineus]
MMLHDAVVRRVLQAVKQQLLLPGDRKAGARLLHQWFLPASNDGTLLSQCNKIPFHIKELVDMKERLISYWPSIKCPSKGGRFMWKNTWDTCGVCSGLGEHDYFKKALELRAKIDLLPILNNNGIISTDYADYGLLEVEKAINSDTLLEPTQAFVAPRTPGTIRSSTKYTCALTRMRLGSSRALHCQTLCVPLASSSVPSLMTCSKRMPRL